MSVEELDQRLATVVGKLTEVTAKLGDTLSMCEESRDVLRRVLDGARNDGAHQALGLQEQAAEELGRARTRVQAVRERIEQYRRAALNVSPDRARAASKPAKRPAAPKHPPNAVGADGSEYPAGAAWAVPELPPRVREGGDRTVAKLKIGDRPIPGEFRSGQHDRWSGEAAARMRSLRVDMPDYLAHHVEVRAAAMMVQAGVRSATVAINNAPCGYQTPPPGCHQLLEAFLPEGSDMTVQGTDRKGRPYQRTYHGRATR